MNQLFAGMPIRVHFRSFVRSVFFLIPHSFALAACHHEMAGVDISGFGHMGDDVGVPSFFVNDGWGGAANGVGGSGVVCCISVPKKWRPNLVARVKWTECDISHMEFKNGRVVDPNARCVLSNHEATVPIPKYDRLGTLMVHFFPGHQVAVVVSHVGPLSETYPWPVMRGYYPSYAPSWARAKAIGIMDTKPDVEDEQ